MSLWNIDSEWKDNRESVPNSPVKCEYSDYARNQLASLLERNLTDDEIDDLVDEITLVLKTNHLEAETKSDSNKN